MNRMLRAIGFVAGLTLFTVMNAGAMAQDVLPVPPAADERAATRDDITLYGPINGKALTPYSDEDFLGLGSYTNELNWSITYGETVIVKIKVPATGLTKSYKNLQTCSFGGPFSFTVGCSLKMMATDFFQHIKDGQTFNWRVIMRAETGEVFKSEWATAVVDEVNAPVLPPSPINVTVYQGSSLTWLHDPLNAGYTVIIKRASDGVVVAKQDISGATCTETCLLDPYTVEGLQSGTAYKWFVKATGYSGETAKSLKQTFMVMK